MTGITYIVVEDHDLSADAPMPAIFLKFGPGRRTIKWRGKRFSVQSARCVGFA